MLGGFSFKSALSNEKGVWVRIRELNYLIKKGIIQVDEEALMEIHDIDDVEYDAIMKENTVEDRLKDMLGRELNDVDRMTIEAARKAVVG